MCCEKSKFLVEFTNFIKLHLMNKVHINMYSEAHRSPATIELHLFFRIGRYRLRLVQVQLDGAGVHRLTPPAGLDAPHHRDTQVSPKPTVERRSTPPSRLCGLGSPGAPGSYCTRLLSLVLIRSNLTPSCFPGCWITGRSDRSNRP